MNKISPREIANRLGVSHVSVYRWIKSGKLKSERHDDGPVVHYTVTESDYQAFKTILDAKVAARRAGLVEATKDESKWIARHREIFETLPPCYLEFKKGAITFQDMQNEFAKRINLASELLPSSES
jgi:excisionase family DNA binding protein